MKTTQGKAVTAYMMISMLSGREMSNKGAWRLFNVERALQDIVDFQVRQEKKLAAELGGEIGPDGFKHDDPKKREEFDRRHEEMAKAECEVKIECEEMTADGKAVIPLSMLPKDMRPYEYRPLVDFIQFKE